VLTFTYFVFRGTKCSGVTMMAAPPISVLMILALHLQCLHTKYFLVDTITNDKGGGVTKKHLENMKHSAPRIKTSNKALIPADKKSGVHNKHLSFNQIMYPHSEHDNFHKDGWKKKMEEFLSSLHLDKTSVNDVFNREHISLEILKKMSDNDLKDIGVSWGHRFTLVKGLAKLKQSG